MTERPRLVDVVFAVGKRRSRASAVIALALAAAAHGGLWLVAMRSMRALQSARLAEVERARQRPFDLEPPPAPEAPDPAPPPPPPPEPPPPEEHIARAPPAHRSEGPPPPPAQAGQILSAVPDPTAPLDLTATAFVTGTGSSYAGGVTTSSGTSRTAVIRSPPSVSAPGPRSPGRPPDLSHPVTLDDEEWSCPWPAAADEAEIDQATALVRVTVGPDGRVESARVVDDPGWGFGAAAVRCARSARFRPALDLQGRPVRASSPPIRVRFTRG